MLPFARQEIAGFTKACFVINCFRFHHRRTDKPSCATLPCQWRSHWVGQIKPVGSSILVTVFFTRFCPEPGVFRRIVTESASNKEIAKKVSWRGGGIHQGVRLASQNNDNASALHAFAASCECSLTICWMRPSSLGQNFRKTFHHHPSYPFVTQPVLTLIRGAWLDQGSSHQGSGGGRINSPVFIKRHLSLFIDAWQTWFLKLDKLDENLSGKLCTAISPVCEAQRSRDTRKNIPSFGNIWEARSVDPSDDLMMWGEDEKLSSALKPVSDPNRRAATPFRPAPRFPNPRELPTAHSFIKQGKSTQTTLSTQQS